MFTTSGALPEDYLGQQEKASSVSITHGLSSAELADNLSSYHAPFVPMYL